VGQASAVEAHAASASLTVQETVVQDWLKQYSGIKMYGYSGQAFVVDAAGNIYVTGTSFGLNREASSQNFETLKYGPRGNKKWARQYNGPANDEDQASDIALDRAGNIYVTGWSVRKSSDSSLPPAWDYATVKYDPGGNRIWVRRYSSPDSSRTYYAEHIGTDRAGNSYVTGIEYLIQDNNIQAANFLTLKYNPAGALKWVRRYHGPKGAKAFPGAMKVDRVGNVYVTGGLELPGYEYVYATVKYDTDGNRKWARRHPGYWANAIEVDGAGNTYVSGFGWTVKYDPDGGQAWSTPYPGQAHALALDKGGNVYATGDSPGASGEGSMSDFGTIKYDKDGNQLWLQGYNGEGKQDDIAYAIAVDSYGKIYVTGSSAGVDGVYQLATIKYGSDGLQEWVQQASTNDPAGIVVDSAGNIYVSGSSGAVPWQKALTIKYSQQ